jgi:hypothetical protein
MKRAFELYPGWLKQRVEKERKEEWMIQHKAHQRKLQLALLDASGKDEVDDAKVRPTLSFFVSNAVSLC